MAGPEWWTSGGQDNIWELRVRWPLLVCWLLPEVSAILDLPLGPLVDLGPCMIQSPEADSSGLRERAQSEAFELAEKEL